ncbi:MAG TPA: hypothetical protein VEB59_11280 [Gemmatimonadales bacterium]|nr:hypothetical protein [Gemmatimonadales bacterium]
MTGPVDMFGPMFDNFRAVTGEMPVMASRFNSEDLVPEESVPGALEMVHQINLSTETLDRWTQHGWCTWRPVSQADSGQRGLLMYVLDRLALFHELESRGWTTPELTAYAEYEDGYVEDILRHEVIPVPSKEDEGLAAVMAIAREERQRLEDEIGARRPREEWPEGWHWRSRSSELQALEADDLAARHQRIARLLDRLENTGWAEIRPERAERLRRQAFVRAMWSECIDVVMLEKERMPLRAGVSWFLGLTNTAAFGPEPVFDDSPERWVERLRVNWDEVFQHPWCDESGEQLPLRVPGLVIVDGQFQHACHPSGFAEMYRRWDLGRYKEVHAAHAGHRICAQCHIRIEGPPSKRFCSPGCNHAHRQAEHRRRRAERAGTLMEEPLSPSDGPEAA